MQKQVSSSPPKDGLLLENLELLLSQISTQKHSLKKYHKPSIPPLNPRPQQTLLYNPSTNYYELFWKEFIINNLVLQHIKELVQFKNELTPKLNKFEENINLYFEMKSGMKKKKRRLACEIEKEFSCSYEGCWKVYGSEVSLNYHIKTIHNGGTKTEREEKGKLFLEAKRKGMDPLPPLPLNFPPRYLEELNEKMNKEEEHNL